jgi:hypothetical protein
MAVEIGYLILDPHRVRGTLCSSTEISTKINKCFSTELAITSNRSVSVSGYLEQGSSRELLDSKNNLIVRADCGIFSLLPL